MQHANYDKEHGPAPEYEITKDLSDLTLMFIVASIIYFLIAGSMAIVMRVIQSKLMLMGGNQQETLGLFYAALTGTWSSNVLWICIDAYNRNKYHLNKQSSGKKPLFSMKLAIWSFSSLNAGVILVIVTGTMFLGAGWYDLMPLIFHPGNNGWNTLSAVAFLNAQVLIAVGITLFCINIIAIVFSGKICSWVGKDRASR